MLRLVNTKYRQIVMKRVHDCAMPSTVDRLAGIVTETGAMNYAGTRADTGRAFNSSSANRALKLRPAEIASTPIPM